VSRLSGAVVATTRDGDPDDPLVRGLRAEGARVLVWPTLGLAPSREPDRLRAAVRAAEAFDWVVFTSPRGVEAFAEQSVAAPRRVRIAAVGPSTARAVHAVGWSVDVVGSGGAEELAARLTRSSDLEGASVLFPAASAARPTLEKALRAAGATVERVEAYHTRRTPPDTASVLRDLSAGVDVVAFASPSAVRSLSRSLRDDWPDALSRCAVVAIGPTTSAAAVAEGLTAVSTAPETTLSGLIDACALTLRG
jgi:uroporphyrinogen-III synthase